MEERVKTENPGEPTIAAVSTAYGESGIGIVRMSGEESLSIAEKIFAPSKAGAHLSDRPRTLCHGYVVDPQSGERLDEALCVYMKAPHSYTGEDVVEIQCHGSAVSIRKILALCLRMGADAAERGEFTKRAFLNGRIDLAQAEAVIDLIKARTDRSYEAAFSQLQGGLSRRVFAVRQRLLDLLVSLGVNMDYPDEDIEEITYEKILSETSSINDELLKIGSRAREGKILRDGLSVAIVGRPNVGKSSLMNALLMQDRSIVTEIPGTTRDTIEESASVRGFPIRFVDTAGIRQAGDSVEAVGVARSKDALDRADLLLLVLDGSAPLTEEDEEVMRLAKGRPCLAVLNKRDLPPALSAAAVSEKLPDAPLVELSAKTEEGLPRLLDEIERFIGSGAVRREEDQPLTSARHAELLLRASEELSEAMEMARRREALDFIEVNCRAAFDLLGEITGETASDQVIEEIFSRFCLGK